MIFAETKLPGVFTIDVVPIEDERGMFARTFAKEEFEARGLAATVVQCSVSYNLRRGTLRGMHYQEAPHGECKLIRCTSGAVYDVVVDLRLDSPTHRQWFATELSAENRRLLYVPEGVAHGLQTFEDGTEVAYQMSHAYAPSHARGVRWDDPAFAIEWPDAERVISPRDRQWPDYRL